MANICIIPARGGSKRIPKKNIKDFLGKPIIAYSIEAALQSNLFDEVMVSTDDEVIAEIAKGFGAKVPFMRSKKNSDDYATTAEVLLEVIQSYQKANLTFTYICCIYPCTPLLTSEVLIKGYDNLKNDKRDSVLSVTKFDFPIQRALVNLGGKIKFLNKQYALTRSQDLPVAYHDAGQFYWLSVESFFKNQSIIQESTGFIELSPLDCQDIDNEFDWFMAENKYRYKSENR